MSATKPQQNGDSAPHRVYDFAEGYGSVYGRYVRKRLCQRLIRDQQIRTVLEVPCNAEAYFASPGTQSIVFADEGCAVTLAHPDAEIVRQTRAFWGGLGRPDTPVVHLPDVDHLPFAENQFDLVWNFDSVPLFDDPPRFIAEMARVSRALVLIIVGNTWNVGYPIHAVACRLGHQTSPWGAAAWMALGPIEGVLRRLGLAIVERGLVDMPPWPGFDALSVVGKRVRRARAAGPTDPASDEEIERRLHRLTFIEYAPLPSVLKIPFAHQHYILARKGT